MIIKTNKKATLLIPHWSGIPAGTNFTIVEIGTLDRQIKETPAYIKGKFQGINRKA